MRTKARLLESINENDAAVEVLLAAHQLSGNDALLLYLAAHTLIRSSRPDEARAMLTRAYELEKKTRIQRKDMAQAVYLGVGRTYISQGQFEKALAVYTEAISAMPRQSLFYVELAELLLRMRQYDDVEKLLTEIRGLELADISQYEYSIRRIARMLAQRLDEPPGN